MWRHVFYTYSDLRFPSARASSTYLKLTSLPCEPTIMKAENGTIKWLLKIAVTVILISADYYYHFQPNKVQYPEGSWVCLDEKLPYSTS